jgi:hypothetical protein
MGHACHPSYLKRLKQEDYSLRLPPGKNMRPYLKNNLKTKRTGGIECLPRKCEALSSNPSTRGEK